MTMTWLSDFSDTAALRERTERALAFPMGLSSPLWPAFYASTTAGLAWWMMAQWPKAFNIEAYRWRAAEGPVRQTITVLALEAPRAQTAQVVEIVEFAEAESPAASPAAEPVAAPAQVAVEPAAVEPAAQPVNDDDLVRITGIGPKISQRLVALGVTRFEQIAAWTEADLARFDSELDLKGRAVREQWVDQAKILASVGKP